jgi:hypothetical protein
VSSRSADIKLIAGATLAVLFGGFLIAGGALVATRGAKSPVCPELNVGSAADIRRTLETGGPYPQSGGGSCTFWLALDDNDIVAYKAGQPSGCTLKLKRDHWECGGKTVDPSTLAQYPVAIRTVHDVDAVIVDLRPAPPTPSAGAPTTTTTSSLPRP